MCRLAGGVSTTFDLVIQLKSGQSQEFSNLPKAELGPVQQYIAAQGFNAGGRPDAAAALAAAASDDSSEVMSHPPLSTSQAQPHAVSSWSGSSPRLAATCIMSDQADPATQLPSSNQDLSSARQC